MFCVITYYDDKGYLMSKDGKVLLSAYGGDGNQLTVPDGVERIMKNAINHSDPNGEVYKYHKLILPESLKEMSQEGNRIPVSRIVFKGSPPKTTMSKEEPEFKEEKYARYSKSKYLEFDKIYVPKGMKQDYIDALGVFPKYEKDVIEG